SLERLGRALQDRLEARLYLLAAVATEQLRDALRPHSAGGHFGVQVAAQAVGQARVADHHPDQVLVRDAAAVELHRRDDQPFLVIRGTMAGHGAGDAAADVIVVPERLDERYHLALVVDRHGNAQVRQVPDPTLRLVDVVVEEDVARLDRVNRKVTDDRLHERRVGAAGQLTAMAVVDSAAEVARLADHRGARGPLDRRLNLRLGRSQRALDDLEYDRVNGYGNEPASSGCGRSAGRSALSSVSFRSVGPSSVAGDRGSTGMGKHHSPQPYSASALRASSRLP